MDKNSNQQFENNPLLKLVRSGFLFSNAIQSERKTKNFNLNDDELYHAFIYFDAEYVYQLEILKYQKPDVIIYNELTEDYSFGWVFYWQVKTVKNDFSNVLIGNGPIIIEKDTLNMYKMMTAISTEENIALYKKDKNKLLQLEEDQDGFFDPVNV